MCLLLDDLTGMVAMGIGAGYLVCNRDDSQARGDAAVCSRCASGQKADIAERDKIAREGAGDAYDKKATVMGLSRKGKRGPCARDACAEHDRIGSGACYGIKRELVIRHADRGAGSREEVMVQILKCRMREAAADKDDGIALGKQIGCVFDILCLVEMGGCGCLRKDVPPGQGSCRNSWTLLPSEREAVLRVARIAQLARKPHHGSSRASGLGCQLSCAHVRNRLSMGLYIAQQGKLC